MSYKLYDAEIEYIETDGASYINTGVKGSSNVTFDIKMYLPSSNFSIWLFGSRVANGDRQLALINDLSLNNVSWRFGNATTTQAPKLPDGIYTFKNTANANVITFSNRSITCTNSTFTNNLDFYIFTLNNNGSAIPPVSGLRIYYAKIFESGILVRDFIPVRVGNVGYLFDKVSMKLFGNSGAGNFVLGPDVAPAAYANEIAFLESTGSQYIDTGITANGEFDFDFKLRIDSWSTNSVYAGARSSSQFLTICQCQDGQHFVFAYLGNVFTPMQTFPIGKDYVIQASFKDGSQIVSVNNVEILNESYTGTEELDMPIYLFKRSFYDSSDSVAGLFGKIYYFKIWQNDTLVRDYIPVEYNNIGYLYDKVSGEFFANQGTGKFMLGHRAPRFDGKACARSYSRRQLMASKLPYDAEVVYLEIPKSTNSPTVRAYINTGYIETPGFGFYVEAYGNGNFQGGVNFAALGNDTTFYTATDFTVLRKSGAGTGYGFRNAPGNYNIKFVWELIQNNNTATYRVKRNNSETRGTITVGDFTETELPILIGYGRTNSVASKKTSGGFYLYRVVFYEYQTIVRDFIPVRVGNVGYMYDKVSGKLFGNAGTGNFILGPDKNI